MRDRTRHHSCQSRGLDSEALGTPVVETNEGFSFALSQRDSSTGQRSFEECQFSVTSKHLHGVFEAIRNSSEVDETMLYTSRSCEVLVSGLPPVSIRRLIRDDLFRHEDPDRGITYSLSSVSDPYLIFLLNKIALTIGNWRALRLWFQEAAFLI